MKFTWSWLKEHLQTTATPAEIAEGMTQLGLEVESLLNPADKLKDIVVAKILETSPHPQADRLKICKVDDGQHVKDVVCGGPNARAGLVTAFVAPGGIVPISGQPLREAVIRGVKSVGMLCSGVELGLEDGPSEGIMEIADGDAVPGTPLADYLGLNDPIFEISVSPNRSDCLSVRGIARDLVAAGFGSLTQHIHPLIQTTIASPVNVKIAEESKGNCPYFVGRVIDGVKNGPSPAWLQQRLKAIGLRPISALVDIINYVMFDIGRPLHVFDADKLEGDLWVTPARAGETLLALNGRELALEPSMTVIRDDKRVLSLAGIMGGEESGCTEATTRIFLESALFDPINIAMTGRALNLLSDSRYRFERGVDPARVLRGLHMATELILKYCGGQATMIISAGDEPKKSLTLKLHRQTLLAYSGVDIPAAPLMLEKLGFTFDEKEGPIWRQSGGGSYDSHSKESVDTSLDMVEVTVPSWRHDIKLEADLVEEVLRLYGFNNLPVTPLPLSSLARTKPSKEAIIRRLLVARGLYEAKTWSFISPKAATLFEGNTPELTLINPISADMAVMRPSLLPNLILAGQRNQDRGQEGAALFEVGAQFESTEIDGQQTVAAGIRTGIKSPSSWDTKASKADLYDVKGDFLSVLTHFGVNLGGVRYQREDLPTWYHPQRAAAVILGAKTVVGYFGELHPRLLEALGVDEAYFGFEMYLATLPEFEPKIPRSPLVLPALQAVERDFAFIVEEKVAAEDVLKAALKADRRLVELTLFDVYTGKGVEAGYKSLGIRAKIQPQETSLTEQELATIGAQIVDQVGRICGGKLRS